MVMTACHETRVSQQAPTANRPSILFVTLDTTRADAIGPEQTNVDTPSYNALARRGLRFRYAYCAVPQTLPSHTSMLTGLYSAGHGVHENARYVADTQQLVSERLHAAGYRTAAFVSAFALAKRFGLARGFDVYDEDFGQDRAERTAQETTDRAIAWIGQQPAQPTFLWVHYYDPHFPYTPPEPYRSKYAKQPYFGEVAYMDAQLGRLIAAFEQKVSGPHAIILAGDHGEGLGDHGESQHGNLMYQSTMRVPLLLIAPGVNAGTNDTPVSTRRIFHTILDLARIDATKSLRSTKPEVVAAEAMKPFLDYGWQPQVMAVDGRQKAILAGKLEVYDVIADPKETHDLSATASITRDMRATLRDYPLPSAAETTPKPIDQEAQRKLAALGYIASSVAPVVRRDAPRPADMAALFPILDEAAALFVRGAYAQCIPLLKHILATDPNNLDSALRLATAYSSLGRDADAVGAFQHAEAIAPASQDVQTYLALHYVKGKDWQKAAPLLERVVADSPDRLPAVEGLAVVRERQGRIADAVALRQKIYTMRAPTNTELAHLGAMQMSLGQTSDAIATFERERAQEGAAFKHDVELGVLYLASGRFTEARDAFDRVQASDPNYPMALFKRAQVSVLLHEQDAPSRIEMARRYATPLTRELIARERLFH